MKDFDQEENLKDMAAFIQSAGYVHRSELQELVEEWRQSQEGSKELAEEAKQGVTGSRRFPEGFWSGLERAASDLEELIE